MLFRSCFLLVVLVLVTQSCLTLCDPMDCSTPGFPVHHQFLELAQTQVRVSDVIQPSHPLSSPSPPAFNFMSYMHFIFKLFLLSERFFKFYTPQFSKASILWSSAFFTSNSHLYSGEGNGNPLRYYCLENPMDGGAWKAAVHGVAESRTRLNDFTLTFHVPALEKEMATHSSVLAWRIPGMGEPGRLPSMGSHRVGHD